MDGTAHASPAWTLERLHAARLEDLRALFATLDAPPFEELRGEYHARLADQGSRRENLLSGLLISNPVFPGRWLCKALIPESDQQGHGYNSFRRRGRTVRRFRMKTSIASSRWDGRPMFQLDYGPFGSLLARMRMVDEVRKVTVDLYLGMGTWGRTAQERMIPRPFTLHGPPAPFVGADPGRR